MYPYNVVSMHVFCLGKTAVKVLAVDAVKFANRNTLWCYGYAERRNNLI